MTHTINFELASSKFRNPAKAQRNQELDLIEQKTRIPKNTETIRQIMKKISPELLKILACPKCKGDLTLDEENNELLCFTSKLAFRIEDGEGGGIPVMLIDEARIIEDK